MNFDKDTMYRLTELDGCFVIGPSSVVVPAKTAKPLIIADTATMLEYLSRYLWERTQGGKSLKDAHDVALGYVNITRKIDPETPVGLVS